MFEKYITFEKKIFNWITGGVFSGSKEMQAAESEGKAVINWTRIIIVLSIFGVAVVLVWPYLARFFSSINIFKKKR